MRFPIMLAALLLTACGLGAAAAPDPAVVRAVFENSYAGQLGTGELILLDFQVTEGQLQEALGGRHYVARYEARLQWPRGNPGGPYGVRAPGEVEVRRGTIALEQVDRGWRAPDGQIVDAR